jgi:hypothetical protein
VCTLVVIPPLLKALEWHLTAQIARDTIQFVEQLYESIVVNSHFDPGREKSSAYLCNLKYTDHGRRVEQVIRRPQLSYVVNAGSRLNPISCDIVVK